MASDTNGSPRGKAYHDFIKRTGNRRFIPEFVASMVRTMEIAEGICLTERVWAWVRWRTWGNSSETAMSSWHSDGWELDQIDCAVDLSWIEQGKTPDEIEDSSRDERARARVQPDIRKRKAPLSRAFAILKARGQVDLSRGRIYALVAPNSPQVVDNRLLVAGSSNYDLQNPDFLSWLQVAGSSDYEEFQSARTSYYQARKVARSRYKEWLEQQPPEAASLFKKKTNRPKVSQSVDPVPETGLTDRLTEIQHAIPQDVIIQCKESPGKQLLERLSDALKDAPVEDFRRRITQRRKAISSLGLLLNLARDVSGAWYRLQQARRQTEQQQDESSRKKWEETVAWYQAEIARADLDAADRELLQKDLDQLLAAAGA